MEDIKLLKELIKYYKEQEDESLQWHRYTFSKERQAIENILNRLEQDEKVIEEMAKELRTRQYNCYGKSVETIIDHFRKKCE